MSVSFDCQPHNDTPSLDSFYHSYLRNPEKLNLRPVYQRNPCWTDIQKIELMDSIMGYCPMPPVLIYKHEGDPTECIDGQNRLRTIKEYIEQTPQSNEGKPFPWIITNQDDTMEYVYFQETEEFKHWAEAMNHKNKKKGKTYRFMTEREKSRFGDYNLVAQMIRTKLSFEHRKAMFNKWQNGSRISQCDALKNKDTPLCNWIVSNGIEHRIGNPLASYLKSGNKNWLFDVIRLLMSFDSKNNPSYFIISTLKVRTILSDEDGFDEDRYERMVEQAEEFLESMQPLIELKQHMTISFLLIWAYLYHQADNQERITMRRKEWMIPCVTTLLSDNTMCYSTLNNGPQVDAFMEHIPRIINEWREKINNHQLKCIPIPNKKKGVPADMRKKLWNSTFGEEAGTALCVCCQIEKITQLNFEAGHVEAERLGGKTILNNLRPICTGCNRAMGTCNMKEWMKERYPQNEFK